MIKNDQGGTRNPYKWMNVMKQDAMDDKIRETCKTCEKQCMQEDLDGSRSVEQLSSRPRWIEELLRSNRDCDKKKLKSSIDSLAIEKLSKLLKNSFSKKRKI